MTIQTHGNLKLMTLTQRTSSKGTTYMMGILNESIKICGVTWPTLRKAGRLELVSH